MSSYYFGFFLRSYLKIFYSLPLTSVNGELKKFPLASAELFKRRFWLKPLVLPIIPLTKVNGNELTLFNQVKFRYALRIF